MSDTQPPHGSTPARDAYRLWAARYEEETAVSALEDHAVAAAGPALADRALLDAGCGIGRRLGRVEGARRRVGVDLVPEMLAVGRARWPELALAAGDVRALPFADGRFDVVWFRLAVGHLPALERAYAELSRVARTGAEAIVTDLHPDAARAGHRRTFRDADGTLREVEHHVHEVADQERAAAAAGWELTEWRDVVVGPAVLEVYARAGRVDLYQRQLGDPLVLVLRFVKREG